MIGQTASEPSFGTGGPETADPTFMALEQTPLLGVTFSLDAPDIRIDFPHGEDPRCFRQCPS